VTTILNLELLYSCYRFTDTSSLGITEKILIDEVKKNKTPSVQYALFDKNGIIKKHSYGFADIDSGNEADYNTTYNAYSVTKTFTALAVLQLVQLGKLKLNDNIRDYLPDIPYNSAITIKQVLSHSAGIPNPIPLNWIHLSSENERFDRDLFFREILTDNNKTKSGPNEKFAYSNLGYVLLGQLIEKISGSRYEDYILGNIIKPLGIKESELGFEFHDQSRQACGYHKLFSFSNIVLGFLIDKSKYMDPASSGWKPFRQFYVNGPSYGGLIGTTDSFITYLRELLNPDCDLINDEYRKMLFTENFTAGGKTTGMCLSWFRGHLGGYTYFAHAGGGGGYYCEIRIYPDQGLGSVIFFNRTGMSDERFLDRLDIDYLENGYRAQK
jgi:D-alanyl-D-alanine carboxypeptidase